VTTKDGAKLWLDREVTHPNSRVCSCRAVRCGPECKKVVTRAVCCGDRDKCPINSLQKPRHKKDWTCRIDVRRTFGATAKHIQHAVNIAVDFLAQQPRERAELFFRRGTYTLDSKVDSPVFTLKNIKPINNGRLIIAGAGMDKTIFKVVGWHDDVFRGTNVTKLTVKDLHLTRNTPGVTQGFVRKVLPGHVILEIPPGFPLPDSIHNGDLQPQRRTYLRKFTNTSSPTLVMEDNPQIKWTTANRASSNNPQLWAFAVNQTVNYGTGDLIGVKSKCCGVNIPRSYSFKESRELLFERVRWSRQSRGVFRLGTQDVTIRDCQIVRDPPIGGLGWCLSTSGGGPQFGQPNDVGMHKVRVENFYSENTGDDSLAFFNVLSQAYLTNVTISDAFSRSIFLHKSPPVKFVNVVVKRNPVCINDNLEDVRQIYGDDQELGRSQRPRFVHDPDGLLGSNCTLRPEDFNKDIKSFLGTL